MRVFLAVTSSFLWMGLSACNPSTETQQSPDETLVPTSAPESVGDQVGAVWKKACEGAASRIACCQGKERDSNLPEAEKTKAYNKCIKKKASNDGLETHVPVAPPETGKVDAGN